MVRAWDLLQPTSLASHLSARPRPSPLLAASTHRSLFIPLSPSSIHHSANGFLPFLVVTTTARAFLLDIARWVLSKANSSCSCFASSLYFTTTVDSRLPEASGAKNRLSRCRPLLYVPSLLSTPISSAREARAPMVLRAARDGSLLLDCNLRAVGSMHRELQWHQTELTTPPRYRWSAERRMSRRVFSSA